jgi:predicted MPP superfamily phosphohydrolase
MPLFFAVVLTLWLGLHVYVAVRLVGPLPLGRVLRTLLYVFWALGYALAPLGFVLDDQLRWPYDVGYRWLVWTYVGAFTVLFACVAARDLAVLALRAITRLNKGRTQLWPSEPDRRRFLLNVTGGAAAGVTGVLTVVGVRAARRVPEVVKVDVPVRGLPRELEGYHIVQLSDVHVGMTIDKDFILPIVEVVTSLEPDLIALTGDIVDGNVDRLRDDVSPLAYLRAPDGVLCVTGNHEYYSGVDDWCREFAEMGITVLNNQHVSVARGAARLVVAGVPDFREGKRHPGHTPDLAQALKGAPEHEVRVLLAHQPKQAFANGEHRFALQLSGHTHGGQYFPWNLFIRLFEPLPTGLTRVGDTWVYVSRGTCYWGPPLRTGVPPEITSLRLRRA